MKNEIYKNLSNLYSLSKTLRFELKPIGKTLEHINQNNVLNDDLNKAETFKKVKKYCDEYHKWYINYILSDNKLLNLSDLSDFLKLYNITTKTEEENKEFKSIESNLRNQISKKLTKNDLYKELFGKELIEKRLETLFENDVEKLNEINMFKKFTTYFTGYNINRANIYSSDEKSTAIAYRLINENLPMFIYNMKIYNKCLEKIPNMNLRLFNDFSEYIQVESINDIFNIEFYNSTLTQKQIEIYNLLIAGKSLDDNIKIKGCNEYINEYNQTVNKNEKIPKMKFLYKQILSDTENISFKYDVINNDIELIEYLNEYIKEVKNLLLSKKIEEIKDITMYDTYKIYTNNNIQLTNISNDIFKDWKYIQNILNSKYDNNNLKNKITETYIEKRKTYFKNIKIYSIKYLNECINNEDSNKKDIFINNIWDVDAISKIITTINTSINEYENIISIASLTATKTLIQNDNIIEKIKYMLDSIIELQEFLKKFILKDNTIEKDEMFYDIINLYYNIINNVIPIYNKVRNYLTQKPYSLNKINLTFNCPTLLNGWDLSKETANLSVMLLKEDKYYLGIINTNAKNIFNTEFESSNINNTNIYKKMQYKLLPGPNKMLPKVCFSEKNKELFKPSKELVEKYELGLHKKGELFDISFCHQLIDYFKDCINLYSEWKVYDFKFSDTKSYKDISSFYKEVEMQGYKLNFVNFDNEYIEDLVQNDMLYLFQIYSKDFSEYSKGTPNLHTMYFKALFDENNLKDIVYKLNGEAEIYFRKASLEYDKVAKHLKDLPTKNKNENTIKNKPTSTFNYDIIKDKRFTIDKFLFHIPIKINFKSLNINNINDIVNNNLKEAKEFNIIGIDRGERNLLYICVINSKGELLEQISLNEIINTYNNIDYVTNYHKLLTEKQDKRLLERKSWKTIENIKELKEGYLSQVISKITDLIKKYNAIIVLEDLNSGFKNSRIHVEKQVYQNFEKKLIEKLNNLVYKKEDINSLGGLYKPYQLTNKFESFKKMSKQSGILYYIPAWCTSKIDPTTGFTNFFNIKYESINSAKEFFNKFDDIRFNKNENYFEFIADYTKFSVKNLGSRKVWTICTYKDRILNIKNNNVWENKIIELTEEYIKLFNKYNVEYTNNLKLNICNINDKQFFENLIQLFKSTVCLRNSITNSFEDYIISPIKNKTNVFYDSRTCDTILPQDADANGAFNIARKGLMIINDLKNNSKINYKITNNDWLTYIQEMDK